MAMYGCVWLCKVYHGCIWLYVGLFKFNKRDPVFKYGYVGPMQGGLPYKSDGVIVGILEKNP